PACRTGAFDHFGCIVEEERRFGLRANLSYGEVEEGLVRFARTDPGGIEHVVEQIMQAQMAPEPACAQMFLIGGDVEPNAIPALENTDGIKQRPIELAIVEQPIMVKNNGGAVIAER